MVLGVYSESDKKSKESLQIVQPLLELINLMIDDSHTPEYYSRTDDQAPTSPDNMLQFSPSSYYILGTNSREYHTLKERYNFSWGYYGHRLMFHWGFDYGKPINKSALTTALLRKNIDFNKAETRGLIDSIKDLQKDRMEQMRKAVDDFFDLQGARKISRGIAGILYYVHLIGDHIECANDMTSEAVLPIETIQKNLMPLIRDIQISQFAKDSTAKRPHEDMKQLDKEMKALNNKSDLVGKEYAQRLLDLLINYLPSTMKYWLSSSAKERGFSFVV